MTANRVRDLVPPWPKTRRAKMLADEDEGRKIDEAVRLQRRRVFEQRWCFAGVALLIGVVILILWRMSGRLDEVQAFESLHGR